MNNQACQICDTSEGRVHSALERMFGFRHDFAYFECSTCGCLQLIRPPADLGQYYPGHYYAYAPPHSPSKLHWFRRWVSGKRNKAQLLGSFGLWGLTAYIRPRSDLAPIASMLAHLPCKSSKLRILDVGCGSGELLQLLASAEFQTLTGVDPFVLTDVEIAPGCHIFAGHLEALVERQFDLIMFHHSLEHIPNQLETLKTVRSMLSPKGVCLIRIPLAASEPWRKYGTDWVELDAPRHYCLHSCTSLELLARRAGLELYYTSFDSTAFAYWGSELYRQNISLYNPDVRSMVDPHAIFSDREMEEFQRMATKDNLSGVAGRGIFYLRHH